jgi:hypothetical protein
MGEKDTMGTVSAGIMLVGIGVIFLAGIDIFPWILALIGLASLPGSVAKDGLWAGLQSAVWLIGLAVLFAIDKIWPGILILIGLSILAGAIKRPPMLESKPKRGLVDD